MKDRQLSDEILQYSSVADKINVFGHVSGGNGDRAASSVRCRSQSQDALQLRQTPNLPKFCSVVGETTYGSVNGGHTPHSVPSPSCSRQLGSSFSVDDDSGSHAPPLAPTPSYLREFGTSSYADDDLHDVDNIDNIPPSAHTPSCLTQLGSSFGANDGLQNVDNISVMGQDKGNMPVIPVIEYAPALNVPVATAPVNEYVASAPVTEFVTSPAAILAATAAPAPVTACVLSDFLEPPVPVEYVIPTPVQCPQLQFFVGNVETPENRFDQGFQTSESLGTAPETNYEGVIEELSKAMEEGLFAVIDEYIENFDTPAPAPLAEYISWLDTGPATDEEKYFIPMTRSQEVCSAARTIQWGWRWMHKRIELRSASEESLQRKLREVRRRLVEQLPVGASAKKTEGLKEIQSTLEDVEKSGECSVMKKWRY